MKILPALSLIIICCSGAVAQKGMVPRKGMIPGYVVRLNREGTAADTLRGFIRERAHWSRPYIDFATTASGETEMIPIKMLKMFYLKTYDSYYYATIVNIDKKPRTSSALESTPGRRIVSDTVLLRLVESGAVNLYEYTDETAKQHFFIQKKSDPIQELDYVRYKSDLQQFFVEMRFYTETLRAMLADCDKVKTVEVRYDEQSFRKVIRQYNSCYSTETYTAETVGRKIRFGVFAGSGPTKFHFFGQDLKTSQDANAPNSKFSNTSSMLIGLNLDFKSKRTVTRVIPGVNVMFQSVGKSTASNQNLISKINLTASNFSFFHTGVGVKFILNPRNKLQGYLRGNATMAFLVNYKTTYTSTNLYTKQVSKPEIFAEPKKIDFSATGGAGITFNRFDAEISYMQNFITTDAPLQLQLKTVNVMLGIRFIN